MSAAIVKAVTSANRGRGSALLELIKRGLANADKYVSGLDFNRGAQILLGNDANVQRGLRRGTAKALEAGMTLANKTPFYTATPQEIKEAARCRPTRAGPSHPRTSTAFLPSVLNPRSFKCFLSCFLSAQAVPYIRCNILLSESPRQYAPEIRINLKC